MNISLAPDLAAFVQARITAGGYSSASELVREALGLLAERDQLRDSQCTALLADGYRAMAADQVREAEAREWCNRLTDRGGSFATLDADDVPADLRDEKECHPGPQTCTRPPLYKQLEALPEWMTGEIINGQVHTEPRPAVLVLATVTALLSRSPDEGRDWCVLHWPELHLIIDTEVLVPDLAAWRRARMRFDQEDQRFTVVPDWVCEVLSPVTRSKDREIKMPIYAQFGVSYLWLVDPWERTLEAYALESGAWREIGRFGGTDVVAVTPFEAVPINLAEVWMPTTEDFTMREEYDLGSSQNSEKIVR